MSRSKLFNMIKSRGEQPLGRNEFDLTNRHVYTAKVAKIMPVKALHTMPDDFFHVSMSEFSQNRIPMNTAAFVSGKKELLAYYVPYNTIWHNYNQYQATREDPESAALKSKGISFEPRFSLGSLYHAAVYFAIGAWMYESYSKLYALKLWFDILSSESTLGVHMSNDFFAFVGSSHNEGTIPQAVEFMKNRHYLSDAMNDWEYFVRKASNTIASWKFADVVQTNGFVFYQPFDCYENNVLHSETLTYGDTFLDMFGTPIWCDWIMKLDMLRFGNIYPLIKPWRTSMDSFVDMILTNESVIVNGVKYYPRINPVFFYFDNESLFFQDFLDDIWGNTYTTYYPSSIDSLRQKIDSYTKHSNQGDATDDEYVNVYSLYAYNKCFYDYMRNVYFDTDYDVRNYNCDFVDCTDWEASIIHYGDIPCRFYHLESHQWKKDFFTGVLPSNQLGAVSQVSVRVDGVVQDGFYSDYSSYPNPSNSTSRAIKQNGSPANGDLTTVSGANGQIFDESMPVQIRQSHNHLISVSADVNGSGSFDVISLKRAEALQQYAQDLMRAGNRTQDIFKQIYGVTPKSQMDEAPYFIEVSSSDLDVNPIIATANTGTDLNGKLGDIAARLTIKPSPLEFRFSTKDFGVVLFLSYIIPDSFYNSYNLDPCNTHLDPESHGLPYFQNLGLQPVIGEFLNNLKPSVIRNRICGYAPPYLERKTDVDLVHGNLVDTFLPKVSETSLDQEFQGDMSHWVVARTDMQQEDAVSLRNFYIDPRIVDNVFQFSADSDLSSDHFLTYCSIKIDSVRALSEIGLPRF